ncbi:hypothetical protein MGWOODY_Clf1969 [hydrothermal vent metagenome]|uniref:Uncharacterized protein n=1 Tax=hydrothermal vent metagenome TaxID=652676 RepID=A0A160VAV5_9ZZZZ
MKIASRSVVEQYHAFGSPRFGIVVPMVVESGTVQRQKRHS